MRRRTSLANHTTSSAEIAARGKEIYESILRQQLEPQNTGQFVVIDIDTGEYEMDVDGHLTVTTEVSLNAGMPFREVRTYELGSWGR